MSISRVPARRALPSLTILLISAVNVFGQGGPPMITDDPGTPGPGKWENNIAIVWEHRTAETSFDVPALDLNYGLGERIQLTLQTAPVILKRRNHGPIGGLGGTEAALKWRFIDQEHDGLGFSLSMFPRVIFNIDQSSARRGLSEKGTRFQLPFQIAKNFGIFDFDVEWGALAITVGRSEWLYGIVAGIEVTKKTELMAELHGTSRMSFDQEVLTVNFGMRQTLTPHCVFIGSVGREVRAPAGEPLAFIGYIGVQLLY